MFDHNRKNLLLLCATVCCFGAGQAHTASSDWMDFGAGKLRLVIAEPANAGVAELRGILDVDMDDGWKTYWREPGASGVPPQISPDFSSAAGSINLHFPAPVWIENKYGDYAGYDDDVQFPLTIALKDGKLPGMVSAKIFMGVCKDVCIPVSADVSVPVEIASTSSLSSKHIDDAFAALPPKSSDALSLSDLKVISEQTFLIDIAHEVDVDDRNADLYVSFADGTRTRPAKIIEKSDNATRFEIQLTKTPSGKQTKEAIITVVRGDNAIEVSKPVTFLPIE